MDNGHCGWDQTDDGHCGWDQTTPHGEGRKLYECHNSYTGSVIKRCKSCNYIGLHKVRFTVVDNMFDCTVSWEHFSDGIISNWRTEQEQREKDQLVKEYNYEVERNELERNELERNELERNELERNELDKKKVELEVVEIEKTEMIEPTQQKYSQKIPEVSELPKVIESTQPKMHVLIPDRYGNYKPGLTLRSDDGVGAYHLIGHGRGMYLSALVMRQGGGEINIPGKRGMGWELAGDLLARNEPSYFPHVVNLDWKKMVHDKEKGGFVNKERNVNLVEYIKETLDNVKKVSEYLEMPKMLEYDQDIIKASMDQYIRNYVRPKFSSGKLRGKRRFENELEMVLDQLDGLDQYIDVGKVEKYKNLTESEACKSKITGEKSRKDKKVVAAERKRIREEKATNQPANKKHKK